MKKIKFNELGEYISKKASEYFNRWYSPLIDDYLDDVKMEFDHEEEPKIYWYKYWIELTEVGKIPLIIEWYTKKTELENENIKIEYYREED